MAGSQASQAILLLWALTASASCCRSRGPLDDELGLLQEASAQAHKPSLQQRSEPKKPPTGFEGLMTEETPSLAHLEVADGVLAWSREGQGPARELREALFEANAQNFLKNVEKVCFMAPSSSYRDCGHEAAERLACPVLFRAAIALVPMKTLEAELKRPSRYPGQAVNQPMTPLIQVGNMSLVGTPPVTISPCLQQELGAKLHDVLGRLFATAPFAMAVAHACLGRPPTRLPDGTCREEAKKSYACRTVENAALSIAGPEQLAKQMSFILGTRPIVIAKNRFDVMDDPCRTRRSAILSFVYKFLGGVLVMAVVFCLLCAVCCALYKL